jgi:hypothetical protein
LVNQNKNTYKKLKNESAENVPGNRLFNFNATIKTNSFKGLLIGLCDSILGYAGLLSIQSNKDVTALPICLLKISENIGFFKSK